MSKQTKKAKTKREEFAQDANRSAAWRWRLHGLWALLALLCITVAFLLYQPALSGPFLFDDLGLPFTQEAFADEPVTVWVAGLRPVLMLSYWLDFQRAGAEPGAYHVTNLLLHCANSLLVFVLVWAVLKTQPVDLKRAFVASAIAATIFLVHPLQTESVAYVAGRSELVCGFFVLAALALFCWNLREVLSWRTAVLIQVLYVAACLAKEQAAVLPAVLLAADVAWGQRPLKEAFKRGARLYIPIAAIGALAVLGVASVLAKSTSAGLNVSGFQWHEYLLTQPGVWLMYLRLAIFPIGQNADYDVPLVHSLFETEALLPLALLLLGAVFAWRIRRTHPIAAGGLLLFAMLLAPTSSIVPIQDLAAERRMYVPLAGLLLGLAQILTRIRIGEAATAGLVAFLLICGALTFERAKVWSNDIALWSDITKKSPNKARGYTHLALAYLRAGRCSDAVALADQVPAAVRAFPEFMGALGHAYACDDKLDEAVKAFEYAAHKWPSTGRLLALASIYSSVGRFKDAAEVEEKAGSVAPRTPYDFLMLAESQKRKQGQTRSRSMPESWQRGGHGM